MEVTFWSVARENEILGTMQIASSADATLLCCVVNEATSWVVAATGSVKMPGNAVKKTPVTTIPITFWNLLNENKFLGTMHLSRDDARAIAGAINSDGSTLWATLENEHLILELAIPENAMGLKEVRGM